MNRTPEPAHGPVVELVLTADGRATVNGRAIGLVPDDDPRRRLLAEAAGLAAALGRDLAVTATDPSGTRYLVARPDGTFTPRRPAEPAGPFPSAGDDLPRAAAPPSGAARPARPSRPPVGASPPGGHHHPTPAATGFPPRRPQRPGLAATSATSATGATAATPPVPSPALSPAPSPAAVPPAPAPTRPPNHPTSPPPSPVSSAGPEGPTPSTAVARRTGSGPAGPVRRVRRHVAVGTALCLGLLLIVAALVTQPPGGAPDRGSGGASAGPARVTPGATSRAPRTPPSTGPLLPAGLPGYSTRAAWAVPVAPWTKVTTVGSVVAARDPAGYLVESDVVTGEVRRRSTSPWGAQWDGPWLTRIGDRPVLALASRTALVYWPPVTSPESTGGPADSPVTSPPATGSPADAPVTVPLPAGAQVTWTGTTPLVTVGAAAWVPEGSTLRQIPLPAGARALAADGSAVLAVLGTTWIRASAAGYQPRAVPPPPGVSGPPARMVDVAGRYLLVVWPRQEAASQRITLVDTAAATVLVNDTVPAGVDVTRAGVRRQLAGPMTAVGQVVVDPAGRRVSSLLAQYSPLTVADGHVYALNAQRRAVDIVLRRPSGFTILPLGTATPVPFALVNVDGARLALLITSAAGVPQLVATPATDVR